MANLNQVLIGILENTKNWNQLKVQLEKFNTSESETTKKKTIAGKIFEVFAKYYFTIDPTQSEYIDAWLYNEIPTEIKNNLNLPPVDHGIDILLRDVDNHYCAVQCKFKNDESKVLSWSGDKIANVFALGTNCNKIIVISNCADVADVAKNLTHDYCQFMNDSLTEISSNTFFRILEVAKGNQPSPPEKYDPNDHQKIAIEAVTGHFKKNNRGQLILPCGAGKTLTALWIKEKIDSKNTLVLVPSLALIKQIKNEWAKQRNTKYKSLFVCSEKDIDNGGYDEAITHTYEIGGNVSTDFNEVASFLKAQEEKVIFSTYQSIAVISKAQALVKSFDFDLIVCDEAHRTAGSKAKTTFTMVHDQTKIRAKKRLYMTATPRVVSANMKTRLKDDYKLICDMSNPETFGEEAYRMTFGEAIERNILVDYKIIGVGVTDKQIKKFIDQREFLTDVAVDEVAHNFALDLVMNQHNAFHGLSFHSRVKYAKEFVDRHAQFFPKVFAKSVNGKQSTTYRKQILNDFAKSEKSVVSNARCLTEGVDVPVIDLIYFCDPKTSKIDIVQSTGRALRKDHKGKKSIGYIIVPIFHHISQDIESEIKRNPIFNYLVQVVRSLCDQDERLESEINKIAFGKGPKNSKKLDIEFIEADSEKVVRFEGIEKRIKESLFEDIIDKTKSTWEQMFLQLKQYHKINGHFKIERKEYSYLGFWASEQRRLFRRGKLDSLKKVKLDQIGFNWVNASVMTWDQQFENLQNYWKQNGHLDVSRNDQQYPTLGYWLYYQKLQYKRSKLSISKYEKLKELGLKFEKSSKSHSDITWEKQYNELREFYLREGHTNITVHYSNPTLYNWVKMTRLRYHKNKLRKDRIAKLEQLKFLWRAPKENFQNPKPKYDEDSWQKNFQELLKFKQREGHCNVKQVNTKHKSLGRWVNDQRTNYQKRILLPHRQKILEEIGFLWNVQNLQLEKAWEEKFEELKIFHTDNGHFNLSQNNDKGRSLYYWIYRIKKNGATLNQLSRLKEIGFNINGIPVRED